MVPEEYGLEKQKKKKKKQKKDFQGKIDNAHQWHYDPMHKVLHDEVKVVPTLPQPQKQMECFDKRKMMTLKAPVIAKPQAARQAATVKAIMAVKAKKMEEQAYEMAYQQALMKQEMQRQKEEQEMQLKRQMEELRIREQKKARKSQTLKMGNLQKKKAPLSSQKIQENQGESVVKQTKDQKFVSKVSIDVVINQQNVDGSFTSQNLLKQLFSNTFKNILSEAQTQKILIAVILSYAVAKWIEKNHPEKQYALIVKKALSFVKKSHKLEDLQFLDQILI